MTQPVYITEEEVEKYLSWEKLFERTENAMKAVSLGAAVQPPRLVMNIPEKDGTVFTMPGYISGNLSCKIVSRFNNNASRGLESILANVLIFDGDTGELKSVVAGCELTARRTAAASAVATRALLKEWKSPRILAFFGAGRQVYSHVHALTNIYKCGTDVEVRIWNRHYETAKKMADRLCSEGFNVKALPDSEEGAKACAHDANIVVTATPSHEPVLKGAWVRPGAHVNLVGHYDADEELYRKSVIYTDTKAAAVTELAHVYTLGVPIVGEIGQVLLGDLKVPEESAGAARPITIFHSLGMAVEDTVSAQLVYDEYSKAKRTK